MRWTGLKGRPVREKAQSASRLGGWIEAALLLVLAIEVAQLLWSAMTPTGPYGHWRARQPVILGAQARQALFSAFDPFYRTGATGDGAQQVTSLPLQLYGIRLNEGSGLGSAIIADQSGTQANYVVGEEIAPGVKLKAVYLDHVVIERGGAPEMLYIDQSGAIPPPPAGAPASDGPGPAGGPGAIDAGLAPPSGGPLSPDALLNGLDFVPRVENGHVTGIVVSAQGASPVFSQAGFHDGDIIVQVNGRPVNTGADINELHNSIVPGARLSLMVERGAATVPIALIVPDKK